MPFDQAPAARRWPALIRIDLIILLIAVALLPHFASFSQQELLVFTAINVLLVASYRTMTLTGEWSLGHVVIMGVGAYGSALFTKDLGVPVPISMVLGSATAALCALLLSFPLFRMKGFYFLIGSFAAGEIIRLCWKKFTDPFGGAKGIKMVPGFPDFEIGPMATDFYEPMQYYYLVMLIVLMSLLVLYLVERSRIGLTFLAIHWQDKLAESVGVDAFKYRTGAFVLASFFAGVSGALLVHYIGTVNPNRFGVHEMVYVLVWGIVGGMTKFYGPILGVVVLTFVNEIALRAIGLDTARPLIYGLILIGFILFLPNGLESLVPKITGFWRGGAPSVKAKDQEDLP